MENVNNIAIIPARGRSKRIPKKNIKEFAGKPIIAYSIQAAFQSGLFSEVMVSTDNDEIATIAKNSGAQVPFYRSGKTSGDYATTMDVLLEVYKIYADAGKIFTNICCIYPCAPFITQEQIRKAYSVLKGKKADTVFPVIQYSHPIQRALQKKGDYISMIDEKNLLIRTQDLPASYHDAGQFYWLTADALLHKQKLITDKTACIELSEFEAHDIDNEMDWKIAELKFKLLREK